MRYYITDVQHFGSILEHKISVQIKMYSGLISSLTWDFNDVEGGNPVFAFTFKVPQYNEGDAQNYLVTPSKYHELALRERLSIIHTPMDGVNGSAFAVPDLIALNDRIDNFMLSLRVATDYRNLNACSDSVQIAIVNLLMQLSSHPDIPQAMKQTLGRTGALLSAAWGGTFNTTDMRDCIRPIIRDLPGITTTQGRMNYRRLEQELASHNGFIQECFDYVSVVCRNSWGHRALNELNYGTICACCESSILGFDDERTVSRYDTPVCDSCYSDIISEDDGYYADDDDDEESSSGLMQYSTNVLNEKEAFLTEPEDTDPVFMGVELEVESIEGRFAAIQRVLNASRDYVIIKSDGSLDAKRGMEIVSVPATLAAHKKRVWKMFFEDKPYQYLVGWTGHQCGMHIHIGRDCMTDMELGKLMVFVNHSKNSAFIDSIAGREAYHYCTRDPRTTIKYGYQDTTDHYDAVSISEHTEGMTAELRIFRSNVNQIGFYKNLEFTDALVRFVKQASILELDEKNFIKFVMSGTVRHQYQHLIEYLRRKGFVKDKHQLKIKDITGTEG